MGVLTPIKMIKIMHLYSAFFICICSNMLYTDILYFYNTQRLDYNTRSIVPYSLRIECGFFNVPCYKTEDTEEGTYGLSSFSEKTGTSNHLQMKLQRQHVFLSYLQTLSVVPVRGSNLRPQARQSSALFTEVPRRRSTQHTFKLKETSQ